MGNGLMCLKKKGKFTLGILINAKYRFPLRQKAENSGDRICESANISYINQHVPGKIVMATI